MAIIEDICNEWMTELADDMKASIHTAVGGEQTELEDSVKPNVKVFPNGNILMTLSMNDYWYWVDKGRGATKKGGTGSVRRGINKEWMTKKGIDARSVMIEIYNNSGVKIPKKGLSYDKAVKALSFLISRKIHKEGYKPRPFFDKIFNEARMQDLKNRLAPVMKQEFILELKQ